MSNTKTKLTISIDKRVLEEAKKAVKEKNTSISGTVENYLKFFAKPEVYCFKCGEKFSSTNADLCPKCGWMLCTKCKVCRCKLDEKTAVAVFHMRRIYEELLSGRVKE